MDLYRVESGGTHRVDLHSAGSATALSPKSFLVAVCLHEENKDLAGLIGPLGHSVPLDEHIRDAGALHHPSYFESASGYDMVVFRGLTNDASALTQKAGVMRAPIAIDTVPTTFFVYENLLVIVRSKDYQALDRALGKYLAGPANGQRHPQSTEELALKLLNELVDNFLALRQPLAAQPLATGTHQSQETFSQLVHPARDARPVSSPRRVMRRAARCHAGVERRASGPFKYAP
jgi:hypothetical protein